MDVYAPLMQTYCRRRGLQTADSADVLQAVFQKLTVVFENWQYDPERGRFRDWLGTVTRHEVLRFLKRQVRNEHLGGGGTPGEMLDDQAAHGVDPIWAEEFALRLLRVALERIRPVFEPATWRVFELTWREGRASVEVALEMGMSVANVFHAKSRVLKRLQAEVEELGGDTMLYSDAAE